MHENLHLADEYTAVTFLLNEFPISLEQSKMQNLKNNENEEKKLGFDQNAVNLKLNELVRMVHGSLESKVRIIEEFNEQNPECSKNSIERKLKENFMKDKRGEDPKHRYYTSDSLLLLLKDQFPIGSQTDELLSLAQTRI